MRFLVSSRSLGLFPCSEGLDCLNFGGIGVWFPWVGVFSAGEGPCPFGLGRTCPGGNGIWPWVLVGAVLGGGWCGDGVVCGAGCGVNLWSCLRFAELFQDAVVLFPGEGALE